MAIWMEELIFVLIIIVLASIVAGAVFTYVVRNEHASKKLEATLFIYLEQTDKYHYDVKYLLKAENDYGDIVVDGMYAVTPDKKYVLVLDNFYVYRPVDIVIIGVCPQYIPNQSNVPYYRYIYIEINASQQPLRHFYPSNEPIWIFPDYCRKPILGYGVWSEFLGFDYDPGTVVSELKNYTELKGIIIGHVLGSGKRVTGIFKVYIVNRLVYKPNEEIKNPPPPENPPLPPVPP